MLPFVTPTTDTRRNDQRAPSDYRDTADYRDPRATGRGIWQGVLLLVLIFSAIVLAVVLATSGGSGGELEPTPTIQPQ